MAFQSDNDSISFCAAHFASLAGANSILVYQSLTLQSASTACVSCMVLTELSIASIHSVAHVLHLQRTFITFTKC
jgi:hypothetical protein